MNLPNKLTILRVCLIPVFLVFFFVEAIPHRFLWALIVFIMAAVTDALDGNIARKRGLVTDFGKLMDPLADKVLVMSAMVSLVAVGLVHAWIIVVILAREFLITSVRQLAAANGKVLAADGWGKMKTIFQMVWISVDIFYLYYYADLWSIRPSNILNTAFTVAHWVLLVGVAFFTVVSCVNYIWKNRSLFGDM